MAVRCILPTFGNTPDKGRCIALHKVPFYNNEHPEEKKGDGDGWTSSNHREHASGSKQQIWNWESKQLPQ